MKKNILIGILGVVAVVEAGFLYHAHKTIIEQAFVGGMSVSPEIVCSEIAPLVEKETVGEKTFSYSADVLATHLLNRDEYNQMKNYFSVPMFPSRFEKVKFTSGFDLEKEKAIMEILRVQPIGGTQTDPIRFQISGEFYNYNKATDIWTREANKGTEDSTFKLSRNGTTKQGYTYTEFESQNQESGKIYSKYLIKTLPDNRTQPFFISLNFINPTYSGGPQEYEQMIKDRNQHELDIINSIKFN